MSLDLNYNTSKNLILNLKEFRVWREIFDEKLSGNKFHETFPLKCVMDSTTCPDSVTQLISFLNEKLHEISSCGASLVLNYLFAVDYM
jgi:hypothetical protein